MTLLIIIYTHIRSFLDTSAIMNDDDVDDKRFIGTHDDESRTSATSVSAPSLVAAITFLIITLGGLFAFT
jgi:hypothetical protein